MPIRFIKTKGMCHNKHKYSSNMIAEISPSIVLEGKTPRLIDKWQEVDAILDAVRYMVDQCRVSKT